MPRNKTEADNQTTEPAKADDAGQAQVQAKVDVETDQGYRGVKVDPLPNLAYSIQTGPDSPTGLDDAARFAQHSADAPNKNTEG
jgi:hypothetical protein